jgi:plastocyanin
MLVLVILLVVPLASASGFFEYYDSDVFIVKKVFRNLVYVPEAELAVVPVYSSKVVEILIEDGSLNLGETEVLIGQTVRWINKREKLPVSIFGMREISDLKSGSLKSGSIFEWEFSETGEYEYVDGIIIGVVGKIIIN